MDVRQRTIGQAFRALGYRTGLVGKWHLGDSEERYPTRRGFDEFIGLREGSRHYWYDAKHDDKPGNPHAIEHNGKPIRFEGYLTDRFGDWASEFVAKDPGKPFLLYLSFTAPHAPLQAKPEDKEKLGTSSNYLAMIHALDRAVGHVIDTLEATGQLDNTLIWFLSDNGGICKDASNAPLAGRKGTLFEGGQRVPFLVFWKDRVPAGKRYDKMVTSLDIFPTSLLAAGGQLPKDRPLDGVDILPYLEGAKSGAPHKDMYWRRMNIAAAREGSLKLIRVRGAPGNPKIEYGLYDLSNDRSENRNLIDQRPDDVRRLRKLLESWESHMMKPLWQEGAYWDKWCADYHWKRFEETKQ
jgi:arylsulfatase A-like enzyme